MKAAIQSNHDDTVDLKETPVYKLTPLEKAQADLLESKNKITF
jgi:hypothetical protein